MRQLYNNDIVRLAKDIKDIKNWSVYFLLYNGKVVYVGYSETPYSRIYIHIRNFNVDKYHILNFATKEEAAEMETHYIKSFKPIQNTIHNDSCNKEERMLINKEFEDAKIFKSKARIDKTKRIEDARNKEKARIAENKRIFNESVEAKRKAAEQERHKKEMAVEETEININIPPNSYIKKGDIYYLKIETKIISSKIDADHILYKGKKYRKPSKVFGNINELIIKN